MTFGVSRASMQPGPEGVPTPVLGIEWLLSISVPPTTAKMFSANLTSALERYEVVFGKIPVDPNAKVILAEAPRQGGG